MLQLSSLSARLSSIESDAEESKLLSLKLLALSEHLALRYNLVLVSGAFGALAGVAYTLLTGMQVPTVRACIAALLVLGGIALGREALSLRLVAVGALLILLFRPEALAGASFQMSFAAVTAIIALHHWAPMRRWFGPQEDDSGITRDQAHGDKYQHRHPDQHRDHCQ